MVVDGEVWKELLQVNGAALVDSYVERVTPHKINDPLAEMVVADLDASVLPTSSGRRWLRARRPELYASLAQRTGQEQETRTVRFGA